MLREQWFSGHHGMLGIKSLFGNIYRKCLNYCIISQPPGFLGGGETSESQCSGVIPDSVLKGPYTMFVLNCSHTQLRQTPYFLCNILAHPYISFKYFSIVLWTGLPSAMLTSATESRQLVLVQI